MTSPPVNGDPESEAREPIFTEEQSAALRLPGISVALSAGAGCGKTTVLTERFVVAISEGDRPKLSKLVALTFTDKAAAELRGRIRERCRTHLSRADATEQPFWKGVLRGLDAAPIGTFHSYCTAILRRNARQVDLAPDFQVLSVPIADTLREEAVLKATRQRLAANDPDLIALAVDHGLDRVRKAVDTLANLRDGAELAAWAAKTPEEVVAVWKGIFDAKGRHLVFAPLLDAAKDCRVWLHRQAFNHPKLKAFREALLPELVGISETIGQPERLAAVRELATLPRGVKKEQWPSIEDNEDAKTLVKSFRDAIDKAVGTLQWSINAGLQAAVDGIRLARMAAEARSLYQESKREAVAVDFDDLLVMARDFLRDNDGDRLENPVEFILVDEFQDTDPVQAEILKSLAGPLVADGKLFLVGDFKQSIYRFRGAEPTLFLTFRDVFLEAGRRALTMNFRSAAGIITFVNHLFKDAFPSGEPQLEPGPEADRPSGEPPVEFLWAVEPSDDPAVKHNVDDDRKTEARWLARRIKEGLSQGWTVKDRGSNTLRQAGPGDVAILFRTLNDLAAYENALAREGLDYHVVGGKAFYNQQEVQDVINILSWIEDPTDSLALAATLRSPFFAVSDEGLFWLGTANDRDLADNLFDHERIGELSNHDRECLGIASQRLQTFRGLKDHIPIADLVNRILSETGYEAALLGEFLGDRKRGNARKMVRLAKAFDDQPGFTLGQFVARLRADQRNPPQEGEVSTANESGDAVRLMTIHQSKGLEFPIVIVPDLNRASASRSRGVGYRSELGPIVGDVGGSDLDDPDFDPNATSDAEEKSLGSILFQLFEREDESAEAIRLFYVATTRARDRLILSAPFDPQGEKRPKSHALRLLDATWDLKTGEAKGADLHLKAQVTLVPPPSFNRPDKRSLRSPLQAIAKIILSTKPTVSTGTAIEAASRRRPRHYAFDRGSRLGSLVRAILADRSALRAGELSASAESAGKRLVPMAAPELTAEALALLGPWSDGSIQNMLDDAVRVERGLTWSLAWPPNHRESTVFSGWTDFLLRDEEGDWMVLNVSLPECSEEAERLRLKLSARLVKAEGMGPVVQGWRIRLGALEPAEGDDDFSDLAIEALVSRLFDTF